PVDAARAVARRVLAHADRVQRVLDQPVARAPVAERVAGREAGAGDGYDLRVDEQVVALVEGELLRLETEHVAGAHARRPELVLAAGRADDTVVAPDPFVPAQRQEVHQQRPRGLVGGHRRAVERRQLARDLVLGLQPGQRQQFTVDDLDSQLDLLAEEGATVREGAPVLDVVEAVAVPPARDQRREDERERDEEEQRVARQGTGEEQEADRDEPALAEHGRYSAGAAVGAAGVSASTGTGTEPTISATTSSSALPRRRVWARTMRRCVSTAGASAFTSSGMTKARPRTAASAWAVWYRASVARGLAPSSSAPCSREPRTIASRKSSTGSATCTRRQRRCKSSRSSAARTGASSSSGLASRKRRTIAFSSSTDG